jgi:hypothetical protein
MINGLLDHIVADASHMPMGGMGEDELIDRRIY